MDILATGCLQKMKVEQGDEVLYKLVADGQLLELNSFLGREIRITSKGEIRCQGCGIKTKKSFNQGYCYRCFTKLASCDRCIMSPELCHFANGTCREPNWGETHCMQEHIVYLANSSGIKVGITRHNQIPTRWIDQGAIQALPIFSVTSRYLSGLVEVALKEWVADKTNWRKMLKHDVEILDLVAERDKLLSVADDSLIELEKKYSGQIQRLDDQAVWEFSYPHISWPEKIKTFNLDKQEQVEGKLLAIKGQYLILDTGCFNVRKFTSYNVSFEA